MTLFRQLVLACGVAAIVGSAVFVAAWQARNISFIGDLSDTARDETFALRAGTREPKQLRAPIVYVAIDNSTFASLGRPKIFPRDRLARLLEGVAHNHPRLVVLDIDLGYPAPADAGDTDLARALDRIGTSHIPILLVRGPTSLGTNGRPYTFDATPFDATVKAHRSLQWVSAQAMHSAGGVVRRVRSDVHGCIDGQPLDFPSAGRAAYRLYTGAPPSAGKPDWSCASQASAATAPDFDVVDFSLRWTDREGPSQMRVNATTGGPRPLLTVASAHPFVTNAEPPQAEGLFDGAIVVIGESYAGAPDIIDTPLGEMPGSFMLVNYVRGLLDFGNEPEGSFIENLLLTLVVSLTTAILMVLADEAFSQWVEFLLPFIVTAFWWLALTFAVGTNMYFGLSLTPLVVGVAILALPDHVKPKSRKKPA